MATLRQQIATNVLSVTKFRDLMKGMQANRPTDDLEIVKKAYDYSLHVHTGQTRASGEPYLVHPLEVALVLAEMKMDPVAVAAGLLHDSVEDTPSRSSTFARSSASRLRTSSKASPRSAKSTSPPRKSSRPRTCAR